jgi:hypothetical protein
MELEIAAAEQHYNSDYINNYQENETGAVYENESEPQENNTLFICLGIVYTLIGLAGCFGNGLVVYVFTRCVLKH